MRIGVHRVFRCLETSAGTTVWTAQKHVANIKLSKRRLCETEQRPCILHPIENKQLPLRAPKTIGKRLESFLTIDSLIESKLLTPLE